MVQRLCGVQIGLPLGGGAARSMARLGVLKALEQRGIRVELIRGTAVVRDAGDAVSGIVESINQPVLARPIKRRGEVLVDGGLMNNVPADGLAASGCNFVIGVSVTAKMGYEFAPNRPDTPAGQMKSASAIQTLLRSYLVQSYTVNAVVVQPADFVIGPDVCSLELSEFMRTNELAALGEQATLLAVPDLRKLLNRLDGQLFPISDLQDSPVQPAVVESALD